MENDFNEEEALKVIRESIQETKEVFRERGLIYLIPGWAVLIAAAINFFLIEFNVPCSFGLTNNSLDITWIVLSLAVSIPLLYGQMARSSWYGIDAASTFGTTRPILYYLWRGISFAMLIVLFFDAANNGTPYIKVSITPIITLLGLFAYVSGAVLKFRPLVIGGYISFMLAIFSTDHVIKTVPAYQLLFLEASVLSSFIVPGHLLRASK